MENPIIHVIDSPMGKGKTTAIINFMNEHPNQKFIYIAPFLDEADRIQKECPNLNFKKPQQIGELPKTASFQDLIKKNENICSTHALFKIINQQTINYLQEKEYTLILDETLDIIDIIAISNDDKNLLFSSGLIETQKIKGVNYQSVILNNKNYKGIFEKIIINNIKEGNVLYCRDTFLFLFPKQAFKSFKEVYILTYLFEGSRLKAYFDLFGFTFDYLHIDLFKIINGRDDDNTFKESIKKLIDIYEDTPRKKLNTIGEENFSLSVSWYDNEYKNFKKKNSNKFETVLKNINNYTENIIKESKSNIIWTVFSDFKEDIKRLPAKSFVSFNCRATNKYHEKSVLIYPVNIFENPFILGFFTDNRVKNYEDMYSISTMIQWIWRSQIRDKKPIKLYIPSSRMRNLLIYWLNS